MLISLNSNESKKTETVWLGNRFFDEQRSDLTITKPNFPENTLVYINQGSISAVKGGHAIYLEFVIRGQLMPVANPDPQINFENHQFKDHEACLFVPIYNKATGMYGGLTKKLAHITLRGDVNERFYSYGFNKEKSTLWYCVNRHPKLVIISCSTCCLVGPVKTTWVGPTRQQVLQLMMTIYK